MCPSSFHKLARDPNKNRNVSVTHSAMRHSTRNNLMTNQTKIMFGSVARDLETFVEQSQLVQAEAMKTFCEMFRSRAFDAAMAAA